MITKKTESKSAASAVTVIHAEVTPAQPSAEHCTTCGNPWPASGPCLVDGTTPPKAQPD